MRKFRNDLKVASVFPLQKHTNNKFLIFNFHPFSVLNNTVLKVHQCSFENFLIYSISRKNNTLKISYS